MHHLSLIHICIVFVDSINHLRLAGLGRREAIVRTGRTRIRPVLMTALTTILAMSTICLLYTSRCV